jgi:hypothetical protein
MRNRPLFPDPPHFWKVRFALWAEVLVAVLALCLLGAACQPAERAATNIGLHQTLPKAAEDLRFPPRDLCDVGGLDPHQRGTRLLAETSMYCQDGDGYKILSQRYVARLYARRASWLDWHVYSNQLTSEARQYAGGISAVVSDVCHYGAGMSWYQVRVSGTAVFSRPSLGGQRFIVHYSARTRSLHREDCGGHE